MKTRPSSNKHVADLNFSRSQETVRRLAWFRYRLRKFLRFSEQAARECGVTPQQHQLLLGIAGYTSRHKATISELAEFLQERHNSVVELVGRAARRRLVRKVHDTHDRRYVFVSLTPRGEAVLSKLAMLHEQEIVRLQAGLLGFAMHGRSLRARDRALVRDVESNDLRTEDRTP
ncbi:MAG: MarR family winged helix-turn-helix transcriptional regulator [Terriglobales bacterium]